MSPKGPLERWYMSVSSHKPWRMQKRLPVSQFHRVPQSQTRSKSQILKIVIWTLLFPNISRTLTLKQHFHKLQTHPSKNTLKASQPGLKVLSRSQNLQIDLRKGPHHYLIFDSNFECGNLEKAYAKSENEYDLYVCSDTNSVNRTQWFYFLVTNTKKGETVKFNIMNLSKYPHFVKDGMKPLMFSEKEYKNMYLSWTSSKIDNVTTTKSPFKYSGTRFIHLASEQAVDMDNSLNNGKRLGYYHYTLSFTHTFKYDNDRVYFAFFKPYSYTRMTTFLRRMESAVEKEGVLYKREKMCNSLLGLPVDLITITSLKEDPATKTYIVITARVHAAETAGSYKIQGILQFLLSRNPIAISLRTHHIFLIVPLLNPDGVVFGNNRCSLAGNDMNRCWGNPSKKLEPAIYRLKAKLNTIYNGASQILVYCDLHGHSKLYNSFLYACHKGTIGTLCSWTKVRLLPRILAKRCHMLNYHQCSFKVEPSKANTARVIIWKEFKVVNSFTLESSQYAYTIGDEVMRFTERDYVRVSEYLMFALDEYRKLLIELHTELSDQNEWLKPCQLRELAGVPAADVLKKEIAEEKEEAKRKERREKRDRFKAALGKVQNKVRVFSPVANCFPSPEKPRAVSQAPEPFKLPQVQNTRKNSKETPSWKDYFTEVELTELQEQFKDEPTVRKPTVRTESPTKGEIVEPVVATTNPTERKEISGALCKKQTHGVPLKISPVTITEQDSHEPAFIARRYGHNSRLLRRDNLGKTAHDWSGHSLARPEGHNKNPSISNEKKDSHKTIEMHTTKATDSLKRVDITLAFEGKQEANKGLAFKKFEFGVEKNREQVNRKERVKKRREKLIPLSFLSTSINAKDPVDETDKKLNFQSFFHYHKCEYSQKCTDNGTGKAKLSRATPDQKKDNTRPKKTLPDPDISPKPYAHRIDQTRKKKPMKEILGTCGGEIIEVNDDIDKEELLEYQFLAHIFSPNKTKTQLYVFFQYPQNRSPLRSGLAKRQHQQKLMTCYCITIADINIYQITKKKCTIQNLKTVFHQFVVLMIP
eukprot:TRINITY_DN249_c1_g1_i1.p1 TRINITY_DN249_c1_g1~~TRINITY_DN249_c1_g1_i1.p1  ORF type:complete len:1041 (-),score=41.47 TRINITY_DN249_c1_g1_i1:2296-5418(-)